MVVGWGEEGVERIRETNCMTCISIAADIQQSNFTVALAKFAQFTLSQEARQRSMCLPNSLKTSQVNIRCCTFEIGIFMSRFSICSLASGGIVNDMRSQNQAISERCSEID